MNSEEEVSQCLKVFCKIRNRICEPYEFVLFRDILSKIGSALGKEEKIPSTQLQIKLLDMTLNLLRDIVEGDGYAYLRGKEFVLFDLKKDLVKIIANLAYRNREAREKVMILDK
jgi:hypothetical protein